MNKVVKYDVLIEEENNNETLLLLFLDNNSNNDNEIIDYINIDIDHVNNSVNIYSECNIDAVIISHFNNEIFKKALLKKLHSIKDTMQDEFTIEYDSIEKERMLLDSILFKADTVVINSIDDILN